MRGALAARWWGAVCAGVALLVASPSPAIEFFEGRLSVTGFYEAQIRGLANNFRGDDGYDLAAWDNVLNIETEAEIAPYGWGPFNLISAFARVEVRYNCVYNHACGIFPSVDAYGDDAQRLPKRLLNGRRSGATGTLFTKDAGAREYRRIRLRGRDVEVAGPGGTLADPDAPGVTDLGLFNDNLPASSRRPLRLEEVPPFGALAGVTGPDGLANTADDPFPAVGDKFRSCRFGVEASKGTSFGVGADVLPHSFNCEIDSTAYLGDLPNPFRGGTLRVPGPDGVFGTADDTTAFFDDDGDGMPDGDLNPRLSLGPDGVFGTADDVPTFGAAELPLRPGAGNPAGMGPDSEARGIWYPNAALAGRVDDFDTFDQNFREEEMQWNRGAAQQDEKELKELYLDIEMFDSRLWLRVGKQNIVWGKTELFRTTDQFNPQDLALATLPSLEESRIPLWAVRGVWSFYEVGPFQDVRLEAAVNFDQFEPTDLGRCGEPFVPRAACDLTFGLLAHGVAQNGLAGMERPEDPWNSTKGLEGGVRLEWRWDRFSFALIDFYGYGDGLYLDRLFTYSRNVDPDTGRPRVAGSEGSCVTGTEEACLFRSDLSAADQRERSLARHSVNQQSFAFVCATSIGFSNLDTGVCAQSVFNSQAPALDALLTPTVSTALSVTLAGREAQQQGILGATLYPGLLGGLAGDTAFTPGQEPDGGGDVSLPASFFTEIAARRVTPSPFAGAPSPLVPLVATEDDNDANDELAPPGTNIIDTVLIGSGGAGTEPVSLSTSLTDAQEALLGCGDFYGTHCDAHGLDLLNAEASALMQSFPGIEGSAVAARAAGVDPAAFTTTNAAIVQPGTVGFPGAEVICNRAGEGPLPGCRSPGPDGTPFTADDDPGFDPLEDGQVQGGGGSQDDRNGLNARRLHPFTGQAFRSEMAVLSWNFLMGLAAFSAVPPRLDDPAFGGDGDGVLDLPGDADGDGELAVDPVNPKADRDGDGVLDADVFDPQDPFREGACSIAAPHFCGSVQALYTVTGVQRRVLQAGGNKRFGRRDFTWQGGGDAVLRFEKRNVLGLSMDFAEDWSKSNWSVEATWIEDIPRTNNDSFDGIEEVDQYNLTVSVDRPTFVSFLNANRTFFINSQWFFRYESNYDDGFTSNGPFNAFFTFTVQTGYFQDRLLPSVTTVFDFGSTSGAVLPQVTYRFTDRFSATFGANLFYGELERKDSPVNPLALSNRAGEGRDDAWVENGLSPVREKDEIFARIRYTF